MPASALLIMLLSTAVAVRDARQHLAEHKLDQVIFDLKGKQLEGQDAQDGATVLGAAAAESREDTLLSLQFAQMALKLNPRQLDALEFCARAAFAEKQFDLAEPCADRGTSSTFTSSRFRACIASAAPSAEAPMTVRCTTTSGAPAREAPLARNAISAPI